MQFQYGIAKLCNTVTNYRLLLDEQQGTLAEYAKNGNGYMLHSGIELP